MVPFACSAAAEPETPPLGFHKVADNVWIHTSWFKYPEGYYPSNGLVIAGRDAVLLVDTAWTEPQTEALLGSIAQVSGGAPVNLVVTHAHDDRLGGMPCIHRRGFSSLAHIETANIAREKGLGIVQQTWSGQTHVMSVGGRKVELFYPGAAHTRDNIVAFVEDSGVLFGGCMVRPLAGTNLGNVKDADVCHWPGAIRTVSERFGAKTKIAIPGHGEAGGPELLTHTITLAEAAAKAKECG
jgi:metallo-beta-lactamase class B